MTTQTKGHQAYQTLQEELCSAFGLPRYDPERKQEHDWYGTHQRLTEEDIAAIEKRADQATPGPWRWTHAIANRYLKVIHPRRARARYLYLLQGRPPGPYVDHWDKNLLSLKWSDLKGDVFTGSMSPADQEFIAEARVDVVRLVAEVRALRAELENKP